MLDWSISVIRAHRRVWQEQRGTTRNYTRATWQLSGEKIINFKQEIVRVLQYKLLCDTRALFYHWAGTGTVCFVHQQLQNLNRKWLLNCYIAYSGRRKKNNCRKSLTTRKSKEDTKERKRLGVYSKSDALVLWWNLFLCQDVSSYQPRWSKTDVFSARSVRISKEEIGVWIYELGLPGSPPSLPDPDQLLDNNRSIYRGKKSCLIAPYC